MLSKARSYARKAVCSVASLALAGTMVVAAPMSAMADPASADNYVSAASYRAAEPAPEILGLSNVATNTAWASVGQLTWGAPYYYIFGTDRNSVPNPYMVNAVYNTSNNLSADAEGYATPTMVYDNTRQGGPTASLGDYTKSQVVWDMLPDVILGNNKNVDYNSADYSQAAAEANNADSYTTIGVKYDSTNIYTMIGSMYDLAAAANQAAATTGKQLRYGDPMGIAREFESYVLGLQGYVVKQLNADGAAKKKVALLNNYDESSGSYTLVQTGVAEGTAASNRYLEAVQAVAVNIADGEEGVTTAKASDLADVDLILVGSQAGNETLSSTEIIVGSLPADLQAKTYYVNSSNGSAGSCYGVVMNSVENAQNIGRILPCLYPEYLDQSDCIAYYYQHFYHLTTGALAETIDNAMDGVRNWDNTGDSSLSWSESTVADYSESAVQSKIDEGLKYDADAAADGTAYSYLAPTENLTIESADDALAAAKTAAAEHPIATAAAVAAADKAASNVQKRAAADAINEAIDNSGEETILEVYEQFGEDAPALSKGYTASDIEALLAKNTSDVTYSYSGTVYASPAGGWVSYDQLLGKLSFNSGDILKVQASDGVGSEIGYQDLKNKTSYFASLDASGGVADADEGKDMPAIIAYNWGSAKITTTAGEAVEDALDGAYFSGTSRWLKGTSKEEIAQALADKDAPVTSFTKKTSLKNPAKIVLQHPANSGLEIYTQEGDAEPVLAKTLTAAEVAGMAQTGTFGYIFNNSQVIAATQVVPYTSLVEAAGLTDATLVQMTPVASTDGFSRDFSAEWLESHNNFYPAASKTEVATDGMTTTSVSGIALSWASGPITTTAGEAVSGLVEDGAFSTNAWRWVTGMSDTSSVRGMFFITGVGSVTIKYEAAEPPAPDTLFADVSESSWYHDVVYEAVGMGLVGGYETTPPTFDPNGKITRGQVATILWRAAGSPSAEPAGFSDVKAGAYYADAVNWAAANGVVTGYVSGSSKTFRPNANITRQDLTLMLARYVAGEGASGSDAWKALKGSNKVNSYARDAIAWGVDNGVIGSSGDINPQGSATRAEATKMLLVGVKLMKA